MLAGTCPIQLRPISTESTADTDTLDIPITQSPTIQVTKGSTTTEVATAGQIVPYTFVVTNAGNISLTGITVTDPDCDATPAYQSGDTDTDNTLDLNEIWTYVCSHTVSQTEMDAGGNLSNTVTVDSIESAANTDTLDIPITQSPAMAVAKSSTAASSLCPWSRNLRLPGNQYRQRHVDRHKPVG